VRTQGVGERPLELRALGEELGEALSVQALRAGREQVLGSGIRVADDELVIQRNNRRGE
jgi:hypothetical protein